MIPLLGCPRQRVVMAPLPENPVAIWQLSHVWVGNKTAAVCGSVIHI